MSSDMKKTKKTNKNNNNKNEKKKQKKKKKQQQQKNECAPSEDSDQPGHLPSLIRVFAVRLMGS